MWRARGIGSLHYCCQSWVFNLPEQISGRIGHALIEWQLGWGAVGGIRRNQRERLLRKAEPQNASPLDRGSVLPFAGSNPPCG